MIRWFIFVFRLDIGVNDNRAMAQVQNAVENLEKGPTESISAEREALRAMAVEFDSEPHPFLRAAHISVCAATSLVLHASAAAAIFLWFEPRLGTTAIPIEAITVELVATEVIEAVTPSQVTAPAAAAPAAVSDAGSTHEAPAEEKSETTDPQTTAEPMQSEVAPAPEETASPAPPLPIPEERPVEDDVALLAAPPRQPITPTPIDEVPLREAQDRQPKPMEKTVRRPDRTTRTPSRKGGVQSRGAHTSNNAATRQSASTGSAINYAAIVRARVAARRPSGQGRHGSVLVTFGISPSGSLSFASITRSSGDRALDSSVLAAVRSAGPFPPPPAGASSVQRRFSMPFDFR